MLATAYYDADTMLKSGTNTRAYAGAGDRDVLIAQLNTFSGQIGMTRAFATPAFEQPTGVAWTGSEIIMAGFFSSTTMFGDTTLAVAAGDEFDIFVTKLTPSDGSPVWAVQLGGSGPDKYPYVTVDAAGDIYLAGFISGSATVGGRLVGGAGGQDVVVAKLRNSNGSVVWATSFGSSGDDAAAGIAISPPGQVVVMATVMGPLQAGGDWAGDQDVAFVSYTSDGSRLWTKVIGSTGADHGGGIASGRGGFYGALSLGADIGSTVQGVAISGPPQPVGLLLRIQP